MSAANFEQFKDIVLQDPELQVSLSSFKDMKAFAGHVVEVGALRGFEFSVEDVEEAMLANRRAWLERWI